jgi:hypothetical protein
VTVDGYWIENWIYYNRTLKYNTTESLRTPSVLQLTTHSISRQLCSHRIHRNRSSGILCQHYPGCCRTAGSLLLSLDTNSTRSTHQLTGQLTGYQLPHYLSGIYDLWTDGREDTFSEETSISRYLGNLPCCLGSEPQRARHSMIPHPRIPRGCTNKDLQKLCRRGGQSSS